MVAMAGLMGPVAAQGVEGAPAALAPPAGEIPPQLREYKLGPGDRLRISVFGHEDLSGVFEVDGTGAVSYPLIGNIRVGGMTLSQVEVAVVAALRPDYLKNPRVSVEVLNYRPFYIMGEVREPGSYPYVNGITVLNAVAIAGGFTYRARESRMTVIRADDPEREEIPVTPDTVVLPGDIIEVPERFF
jgi:polysaccharide export outer membrane protein